MCSDFIIYYIIYLALDDLVVVAAVGVVVAVAHFALVVVVAFGVHPFALVVERFALLARNAHRIMLTLAR